MSDKKTTGGSQYTVYGKTHYQRNRTEYVEKNKALRRRNFNYVKSIKEKSPCTDCGVCDWRLIEFDHINNDKYKNVAILVRDTSSLKKIQQEIDKCEPVCCNCHRIRTLTRAGIM